MMLIDFNIAPKSSFKRGFVKGLGAPAILFSTFNAPELPQFVEVESQAKSTPNNDWVRVANDFHVAIAKYGKTQSAK